MMSKKLWTSIAVGCMALALGAQTASAEGVTQAQLQKQWENDVVGKQIVYIPVSFSQTLPHIWGVEMQKESEALGIDFKVRDPDFNTQREEQILSAAINQHPDLLVVHNPNVQVLARDLERAQKAGIYVIQVNMASKYKTDAFVGIDPVDTGKKMAQAIVDTCSGSDARSNKVALMNGEVTSAYSLGIMKGAQSVFKANPNIKIVSNQSAGWVSKTAHDKAATVLENNPDLCAYMDWWSGQGVGVAQAVQQAGLKGKVKVFTTGGGEPPACEYIEKGLFYEDFNYQARLQAHQIMAMAKFLLQSGEKPGTHHVNIYTPVVGVTKENLTPATCTHTSD